MQLVNTGPLRTNAAQKDELVNVEIYVVKN